MFSCVRKTFNHPQKLLIINKSFYIRNFSAFSLTHDRISYENNVYIKIKKPNLLSSRDFSLRAIYSFYDALDSSEACKLTEKMLVETHDFTGLSWTSTIILVSAVMKLFIAFPCGIYQKLLMSKLELIEIELRSKVKGIKEKLLTRAIKEKWTKKKLRSNFMSEVMKERKTLIIEKNCHPFKTFILFLIQFPFWLILSFTIRKFAVNALNGQSDYPTAALQFQVGGPFWCQNLSLPDPTFIIPTINFFIFLICSELSFLLKTQETVGANKAKFFVKKILPNFLRLFGVVFFFISAASPSGLSLFWMSSTFIALAQNLLLISPNMKRFLKIPKTPSEFDKPFSEAWNRFLGVLRIFSSRKE